MSTEQLRLLLDRKQAGTITVAERHALADELARRCRVNKAFVNAVVDR